MLKFSGWLVGKWFNENTADFRENVGKTFQTVGSNQSINRGPTKSFLSFCFEEEEEEEMIIMMIFFVSNTIY